MVLGGIGASSGGRRDDVLRCREVGFARAETDHVGTGLAHLRAFAVMAIVDDSPREVIAADSRFIVALAPDANA